MNVSEPNETNWDRKIIEKIALEGIAEQRRSRRWGIFFKLLGFAYVTVLLVMLVDWGDSADLADGKKTTALVDLSGVIQAKGDANAENVISALQAAFKSKHTAGVVLRINSPGGSPVQAGMINDEIRRLRTAHPEVPLYAVVEDVCASGGYYIAAAADKIYVDKASIVGSIGVLMDGFGFTGTMDKLGVERRLLTAGQNKGFLDPFSAQNSEHKAHAQDMLDDIHHQFIEVVRKGRGKRLKETPDMFSGLMWTGAKSIELGLADGYGTLESVARDVLKAEDIRDYTIKSNFAEKFAKRLGADMAEGAASAVSNFSLR
ncbi:MAG: S49 family peptidase [Gammaproteobacteria bacterium]|nr:S49 family peptidase [Gammaproteobacteria bacterium]MBU1646577.1 S49 family peptidase [Gammaproteobacteria bacterium]MBU1972834.1 S49 family peptidase [Gammaproteobacteria bacterium]